MGPIKEVAQYTTSASVLIPCGAYWQETANTSPVPLLRNKESPKQKNREITNI
jgi:hypothetical protein